MKATSHFESKVVSVEVYDKSHCHWVSYKKARKQLWNLFPKMLPILPEGYYTDGDHFLGNSEDLLGGSYQISSFSDRSDITVIRLVTENNVAYFLPYVEVKFESGDNKILKFNTVEECNECAIRIGNEHKLLNVSTIR